MDKMNALTFRVVEEVIRHVSGLQFLYGFLLCILHILVECDQKFNHFFCVAILESR